MYERQLVVLLLDLVLFLLVVVVVVGKDPLMVVHRAGLSVGWNAMSSSMVKMVLSALRRYVARRHQSQSTAQGRQAANVVTNKLKQHHHQLKRKTIRKMGGVSSHQLTLTKDHSRKRDSR